MYGSREQVEEIPGVSSGWSLETIKWLGQLVSGLVTAKVQLVSDGYVDFNLMVLMMQLITFSLEIPTKRSQVDPPLAISIPLLHARVEVAARKGLPRSCHPHKSPGRV